MPTLSEELDRLAKLCPAYEGELRLALTYLEADPGSSLTKSRMVAEKMLVELFTSAMGRPPRKPLLGDILTDNQFTRRIERRILSRFNSIRDMGNLGPHGERVQASDARRILEDLCEVISWYGNRGPSWSESTATASGPLAAPPPSAAASPSPSDRPSREGQWRRLTVVQYGCDLFDSEALLDALDPEEQHDMLREFQQLCRGVAAEFQGTIVAGTDHGLRVCFGFPVALEDAARRAVRAGLCLLDRMAALNECLSQRHKDLHLAARIAVHSNRGVVTASSGPGEALSIVGPLLSVVDQIEHLAAPDTVVISDDTYQLVKGFVECTSLGAAKLLGARGAKPIYCVRRELAAGSRLDAAGPSGLTPLIGRDRETALLQERWEQAVEGVGQVVLLVGEAGIGKSRQVRVLKDYVAGQRMGGGSALIIEWSCTSLQDTEGYRIHAIESFERIMGLEPHDGPTQKLEKLVAHLETLHLASTEAIALLASLLLIPLDGRYPPLGMSPLRQKEKTIDLQVDWLRAQAQRQPVLFVIEDLHWAGPTTLEFLDLLVGQVQSARLLTLFTFRPEFAPSWRAKGHQTQVPLNRLSRRQTAELMLAKSGLATIPQGVLDQVAARTDGVPLFVEEFTAMVLEAGALCVVDGELRMSDTFDAHAIPATLQDLLMARLDRMASKLDIVQLAAAIGREFSYELLSAVAACSEEALQRELAKLVEAELLFQHGRPPSARYQFKHALIQDAAYQSLLKKKRQQLHLHIAEVLEQRFPETCANQPELLAHHFTEGNGILKAVTYWEWAGERAHRGGAAVEAIGHFTRGLELIRSLPETPARHAQEIKMHIGQVMALQAARGYSAPEAEAACARAYALCRQTGLGALVFPALQGLCRYYFLRGEHVRARELAEDMLRLPDRELNPGFVVAAQYALGATLHHEGKQVEALAHLEKAVAIEATAELRSASNRYDVLDPWVIARMCLARILWLLGYAERAAEQCRQAVTTAEGLNHPFSLCYALSSAAWLHQFLQDRESTRTTAERALTLATEKGFPFLSGWTKILCGLTLAEGGQCERAVTEIRQGLADLRTQGSALGRSCFLTMLAETLARAGRLEEGLEALGEAQEFADATGENYWQAEILRLKGELRRRHDPTTFQDAEVCFHQALEVARAQQARAFEVRAAMSLGRLWHEQGKTQAARELVAKVYGAFTEGFQTPDLQAARALLELCGGTPPLVPFSTP